MTEKEKRSNDLFEKEEDKMKKSCLPEQKEIEEIELSAEKEKDKGTAFNEILLNLIIDLMTLNKVMSKKEMTELRKKLLIIDFFDLNRVKFNDCLGHFYLSKLALIEERLKLFKLNQLIDLSKIKSKIMQKIREGIRNYSDIEMTNEAIKQMSEKSSESSETASGKSNYPKREETDDRYY